MIFYVTHHDFARTIWSFKRQAERGDLVFVRPLSYRALFNRRRAPIGHYIFTDFDRLSTYEIQAAEAIARRVQKAAPEARILNRPAHVLERYALLRRLAALGLNDFSAYRLDSDERPRRYPVFIRLEDDCQAPDTPLLHSESEFLAAIESLRTAGVPLKRRIAVEFCAQLGPDGFYRKYGVFKVGGHLVPHHIHHNTDWYVKRQSRGGGGGDLPAGESLRFVTDIPHAAAIERAFSTANIDFGRIDYGVVNGRLQTYEINTNPTFPPLASASARPGTEERRVLMRTRMLAALKAIDSPLGVGGTIDFALPAPPLQKFDALPLRARWLIFWERMRVVLGR